MIVATKLSKIVIVDDHFDFNFTRRFRSRLDSLLPLIFSLTVIKEEDKNKIVDNQANLMRLGLCENQLSGISCTKSS